MKDLNKFFRNPPKGGNEKGVETASSMAPIPASLHDTPYGTGQGVGARRRESEWQKMSPEARFASVTAPSASDGPAAQTSLRESFEAGEQASRTGVVQSGRVGQAEVRNFDRGYIVTQEVDDPSGLSAYDYEAFHVGSPHGTVEGNMPKQATPKVTPVIDPDTAQSTRSDGKPVR